jgi:hypothetical protein
MRVQGTKNGEVSTLVSVDGTMRRGHGSGEGVGARTVKGLIPRKMETPMVGWRLVAMHEDVGLGGQATFIWLEEECIETNTRVPYKVYNSRKMETPRLA